MSKRSPAWGLALHWRFVDRVFLFKPSVAHARCVVVAEKPTVTRIMGQRAIMAVGARGPDCTEAKMFFVRLRQHRRFWPDKTLAEVRFSVKNGRLRTHYICNGAGEKGLFTEAWVQFDEKHRSKTYLYNACG